MKIPSLLAQDSERNSQVSIGWAPANLFFQKTIYLPEGLENDTLDSFAELEMEQLSPFPLEQLAWGFFRDLEARAIFLFAAVKPRLPETLLEHWDGYNHVYASFVHLIGIRRSEPTLIGLYHGDIVTGAYYDGESPFPTQMVHRHLPRLETEEEETDEEESEEEQKKAFANDLTLALNCFEEIKEGFQQQKCKIEPGLMSVVDVETHHDDVVVMRIDHYLTPFTEPEHYDPVIVQKGEGLWASDLRQADFIEEEKRRRQLSMKLWVVFKSAGFAALIIFFLLLWNVGMNVLVSNREARMTEQSVDTFAIIDDETRLNKLKQFTSGEFRPFDILGTLNELRIEKTPKVYFKSIEANSDNQVTIKAIAGSVPEANKFRDILRERKKSFPRVVISSFVTKKKQVEFSIQLNYNIEAIIATASEVAANEES